MIILVASNTSWNIFNFRLSFLNALKNFGHEVYFCAPEDKYTKKLSALGFSHVPIRIDRKSINPLQDLLLFLRFLRIYKKIKPDFIFHYTIKPNIYGGLAAAFTGAKCINTVSGLGYVFIEKKFYYPLVRLLYKASCRLSKKTFFHNEEDLAFFIRNRICPANKALAIKGSGVDTDYFNPALFDSKKAERHFTSFIYIGRLLWDKGIQELIDGIRIIKKRYPDTKLTLIGKIDKGNPSVVNPDKIEEWREAGLIEYMGEVEDVRPFLSESDCLILPSYREGVPRSVLEAMSMGKPVIAADTAGCRDLIRDGVNGFLVPVKNSIELSCAMQKIIETPRNKQEEMGSMGREIAVSEFDEKKVVESYVREIRL